MRVGAADPFRFHPAPAAPAEARVQGLRSGAARGAERLARAFREEGRPLQHAGALCAWLCRAVPRVADPPDIAEVCRTLREPPSDPLAMRPDRHRWVPPEDPPRSPGDFQEQVLEALEELSSSALRHWLRQSRGPIGEACEQVARAVPRTLAGALEELERRPRLAGAASLVAQLADALALTPRRLAYAEQPTGGYADVATRGLPEQILPEQLALDGEEFVRRFAEHELLYFHREEPHRPVAKELVVLLDQGVRTWGEVRLVLAGATLALGRQAMRRGTPFLIAATSTGGRIGDPLQLDGEALGGVLESSDLSPDPGQALGRVLESPAVIAQRRPADPSVEPVRAGGRGVGCAASRPGCASSPSRWTAAGRSLSPRSAMAPRSRSAGSASRSPRQPPRRSRHVRTSPRRPRGKGTLSRSGSRSGSALSRIDDHLYDFDVAGDWLLLAGLHGLLHAWRADGSEAEMLPRASGDR